MDLAVQESNRYHAEKLLNFCMNKDDCRKCEFYLDSKDNNCKIGRPFEWLLNISD